MKLRSDLGIPGPEANFFFGNVLDLAACFKKVIFSNNGNVIGTVTKHNFYFLVQRN